MTAVGPLPDGGPEIYEGDMDGANFQARSSSVGSEFKHVAREFLIAAGAAFQRDRHKVGEYNVEGLVAGGNKRQFLVLAHGVIDDASKAGLKRTDTLKKAGFDAIQIRRLRPLPILLITSHIPEWGTSAAAQLGDCARDIFDVIGTTGDLAGFHRLQRYLHEDPFPGQLPAEWRGQGSEWTPELFDDDDEPIPFEIRFGAADEDAEEVF